MSDHWGAIAVELLRLLVDDDAAAHASESLRARALAALPALERRKIASLYYMAFEPEHPVQRLCDRIWVAQRRALREAVALLTDRGIPAIVYKGVEFLARHFGSHRMHNIADADVLVPRAALGAALVALQDLGYDYRVFERDIHRWRAWDPIEIARDNAAHDFEMAPLTYAEPLRLTDDEIDLCRRLKLSGVVFPESGPECRVTIDLHYNVGSDFRIEHLLPRAESCALGAGLAFSASDHLWIAALRYYSIKARHDAGSLHHLAYLTRHLARSDIDWDLVVREVTEVNAHVNGTPAMFYTLGQLARIDERLVPREILDRVRPSGRRLEDWGWQVGKLFGFTEPCPLTLANGRLEGSSPWKPERS